MTLQQPDWTVLLIGGPSGVGKTVVAQQLGLRLGFSWMQVDDLRLALQASNVTLPQDTDALYFFLRTADVWRLSPEQLCEGLMRVGEVLSPALEIIITNHVATAAPIIIEGDGILPSLLRRSSVQERMRSGQVQAVFITEPDEQTLYTNMVTRNRGIAGRTRTELQTEARAKWLYGQWLAHEAHLYDLPTVTAHPWSTLYERIIAVSR